MVLLGLGIALLSVVLLSYQHGPEAWSRTLRRLITKKEHGIKHKGGEGGPGREKTGHGLRPGFGDGGGGDSRHRVESSSNTVSPLLQNPTFTMIESDMDEPASSPSLEQDQTTPKASATPAGSGAEIPTFALATGEPPEPASQGLSRGTVVDKPSSLPSTSTKKATASSLMPPPSIKPSALRPLPGANEQSGSSPLSSSLMPPPSSASALRVPPGGRSPAPNSIASSARNPATAASTSTLPPASRPSRKVILPPGHSPLDWAALCRNPPSSDFLRGKGVPHRMLKVSPAQLKYYNGRKERDAWGTWQGKVYNLTPYKNFHPGGVKELMRGAGRPGETERLFKEVHPWVNWDGMLADCLVGVLVGEGEGEGESGGTGQMDMDAMD